MGIKKNVFIYFTYTTHYRNGRRLQRCENKITLIYSNTIYDLHNIIRTRDMGKKGRTAVGRWCTYKRSGTRAGVGALRVERFAGGLGDVLHRPRFAFAFGTGWLGVVRIHARRGVLGVEPSWLGSMSTREGVGGNWVGDPHSGRVRTGRVPGSGE